MRPLTFLKPLILAAFLFTSHAYTASADEVDIAVVGGGLSGLRAVSRLQEAGQDYALFEGKEQLGGRTVSETRGDQAFNMGGEWIESDDEEMIALAKKLGLDLQKETYDKSVRVVVNGRELTLKEQITFLKGLLPKLEASIGALESGSQFTEDFHYKRLIDVLQDLTPEESSFVNTYLKSDNGLSPEHLNAPSIYSLREDLGEFLALFEYKNSWKPAILRNLTAYQYRVKGGMTTMIEALQGTLDPARINLGHKLVRIFKDHSNKFHLIFEMAGGHIREVIARTVIMTVPFSVLRTLDLDESLELSDLQKKAINELPYGTNAKIQVVDDSQYNLRYGIDTDSGTISWEPPTGRGSTEVRKGLTIFMGGEEGAALTQESAASIALPIIERFRPSATGAGPAEAPAPELLVKNWSQDPFALGSYSSESLDPALTLPSAVPELEGFRQFAEPTGGFIFAGEHTQLENAYMESAVRSGRMAAEYYLQHQSEFGR